MQRRKSFWGVAGVLACTFSCAVASTVTVEPGDVTALTNHMATLSGGSTIILKPGVYDLSQVHGTYSGWSYYHLIANGKKLIIMGQNTKHWSEKTPEEETILRGDGTAAILYGHGGGGRQSSVWHISFENGYRPEKAPDGTGIGSFGGGALSWAQTEQGKPALGNGLASNCVFRGCSSAYNGGATHGVDAFDCFYTNNTCAKAGGATRCFVGNNSGSTYHTNIFKNCVFIDNKALNGAGGAIYGQVIDSLTDCTFIGNTSSTGGGGVYCETPMSVVTNCTFIGNVSGDHGGGLVCASAVGAITDCAFTNNTSGNRGGGLLCGGKVGTISGCVFKGNTANGIGGGLRTNGNVERITGCKFLDNTAAGYGGGCSCGPASFFGVEDCEFTSNKVNVATDSYGGGLSTIASVSRISGSTFTGNLSLKDGGGLFFQNDVVVSNCTFRENVARQYGGGVLDLDTRGTVIDSFFDGNTNAWGNYGSQVRKVRQVTGCTFTGWGDMMATSYDRCTFDGCKFNYVTWADGMVQFASATGAGHIRNCLFKGCSVHPVQRDFPADIALPHLRLSLRHGAGVGESLSQHEHGRELHLPRQSGGRNSKRHELLRDGAGHNTRHSGAEHRQQLDLRHVQRRPEQRRCARVHGRHGGARPEVRRGRSETSGRAVLHDSARLAGVQRRPEHGLDGGRRRPRRHEPHP